MADRFSGLSENLRGILLMVLAMASFAVADTLIKLVSDRIPPGQIIIVLGVGGTLIFGTLAVVRRQPWSDATHPVVVWRNIAEALGTVALITALTLMPLSTASAIMQTNPIVVTMGAALLLGEKVGVHRWTAIVVGMIGMLLVIRPGSDQFDPNALLAVTAMVALAARDLFTRRVPRTIPNLVLATLGFVVIVPAGAVLLLAGLGPPPVLPTAGETVWLLAATAFVSLAYFCITAAVRLGDISVLSPFRYTRIVFAIGLGIVVFGERPDAWMYLGVAIIIGSGIYTFWRERRIKVQA